MGRRREQTPSGWPRRLEEGNETESHSTFGRFGLPTGLPGHLSLVPARLCRYLPLCAPTALWPCPWVSLTKAETLVRFVLCRAAPEPGTVPGRQRALSCGRSELLNKFIQPFPSIKYLFTGPLSLLVYNLQGRYCTYPCDSSTQPKSRRKVSAQRYSERVNGAVRHPLAVLGLFCLPFCLSPHRGASTERARGRLGSSWLPLARSPALSPPESWWAPKCGRREARTAFVL